MMRVCSCTVCDLSCKLAVGKLIGSGAILLGTLVVALPTTVIVENFQRTQKSFRLKAMST